MANYQIDGVDVTSNDPALPELLKNAYARKIRPRCMCRRIGVEMYIANLDQHYIIKRMPNSGHKHDPDCDTFEAPAELSGRGEVDGRAIVEDQTSGITNVKIDVSLTKSSGKKMPEPSGVPSDTVKADSSKLTLSALMEYLWEEAGLSKWTPAMSGKRSWFIIQRELLNAAQAKATKGKGLADLLLIPERYSIEEKSDIAQRRHAKIRDIGGANAGKKFMLLIGEVKEIAEARYGYKIIVKHMPDFHFMLPADLHKKMVKRFANELQAAEMFEDTKLMVIATFGLSAGGYATIEELTLKTANAQWLFFDSSYEHELLATLVGDNRRFQKCLRFNQPPKLPMASVLLTDTKPDPVAMYVIPAGAPDELLDRTNELIDSSSYPSWVWQTDLNSIPALPDQNGYIPKFSKCVLIENEEAEVVHLASSQVSEQLETEAD